MAVAKVQDVVTGGYASSSSLSDHPMTVGVTTTVGNHLILRCFSSNTGRTLTVDDTKGNTWQVDRSGSATAPVTYTASCKISSALVSGDTITFHWTGGSATSAATVIEISGADATTWYDQGADATGTGTSADSGATGTLAQADNYVVGQVAESNTTSSFTWETTSPTWTAEQNLTTSGTVREGHHASKVVAATTALSAKATWTTSRNWHAQIDVYKAAAGGGAVLAGSFAALSAWSGDKLVENHALAGSEAGTSLWQGDLTAHGAAVLAGAFAPVSLWQADLHAAGAAALAGAFAPASLWQANLTAAPAASVTVPRIHRIQYHGLIFAPDANGGPGLPKYELDGDMLNVVWNQALNGAGQAAFTLTRFNPKVAGLNFMQDHVKIYRETSAGLKTVFAGKIVKPSEGTRDVIVYCWDYMAFLQRSRTGFKVLYPQKLIGTEIVQVEWGIAKAVADSPFAFVQTGTFEDPLGLDGTTKIKTNDQFGVSDFDRLFTFYALAELSMANTSNSVVFEITRESPHTFNFWKNKGTNHTNWHIEYPGNVVDYDLNTGQDEITNDIATPIVDPTTGQQVEYVVTDPTSIGVYRRLQAALTIKTLYGVNSGTTESDQQKAAAARLLSQAVTTPKLLVAFPRQGEIEPFVGWDLGDSFRSVLRNASRTGDRLDSYLRAVGIGGQWTPAAGELLQVYMR